MSEFGIKESEQFFINGPLLVIFRGIPGCGKTSIAETIQEKILNGSYIERVDPDLINKNDPQYIIFTEYLQNSEPDLEGKYYPYRYLLHIATENLKSGKIVFWDQPFTDLEGLVYTIRKLTKDVAQSGGIEFKVFIVDIETPLDKALERVKRRKENGGHGPSDTTFYNFVNSFHTSEDLKYGSLIVSGDDGDMERSCIQILTMAGKLQKGHD